MTQELAKIAIIYDFDGTLARGNIQSNSYIPEKLNTDPEKFWKKADDLAEKENMDTILAYMFLLIDKNNNETSFTREDIQAHGKDVKYFKGVEAYFDLINNYAKNKSIKIEHYIISSGTKEMIEQTSIAKEFEHIYASSFKYDKHGIPEWPSLAINYTNKTQFLFRISSGIKNVWDNTKINKLNHEGRRQIPFENMIYIGDGETDIPAMLVTKSEGGHSIAVYDPKDKEKKEKIMNLFSDTRVDYIASADYSANSHLMKIVKSIIDKISAHESIRKFTTARQKQADLE